VTLDWMLDRMEVAVVRHGVQVIVIDPWNEMDHTRARDETMTEYVGRAIKALKRFARKFQVHLIVIAHPTKSPRTATASTGCRPSTTSPTAPTGTTSATSGSSSTARTPDDT
jgi:RecA-family ATPase